MKTKLKDSAYLKFNDSKILLQIKYKSLLSLSMKIDQKEALKTNFILFLPCQQHRKPIADLNRLSEDFFISSKL